MRWKRVPTERVQPEQGSYSEWKPQIANDCAQQCVYCAISESRYGGIDNFHVEHFRPKSLFCDLEQVIANLFLACAICNRFKSNDWPTEPLEDHSQPAYLDPSAHDYNELFDIDPESFLISGRHPAPVYVTERLYLNRPQLILERRAFFVEERISQFHEFASRAARDLNEIASAESKELMYRLLQGVIDLQQVLTQARNVRPYEPGDIRR